MKLSFEAIAEMTTYDLLAYSLHICRNCDKWLTDDCPNCPDPVAWSSSRPCAEYTPNENTENMLQELTMRKLKGHEITYTPDNDDDDGDERSV